MAIAEVASDAEERPSKRPRFGDRLGSPSQQSEAEFEDTEDFYESHESSRLLPNHNPTNQEKITAVSITETRSGSIPGLGMLTSASSAAHLQSPASLTDEAVAKYEYVTNTPTTDPQHQNYQDKAKFHPVDEQCAPSVHIERGRAQQTDDDTRQIDGSDATGQLLTVVGPSTKLVNGVTSAIIEADGAANLLEYSVKPDGGGDEEEEWAYDSSDDKSNSSSDPTSYVSSAASEDDSGDETYKLLGPEEQARLLMQEEGGSDDEGKRYKSGSRMLPRTTNEKPEELVQKPDIAVTEDMSIPFLGVVEGVVENYLLIRGTTSGEIRVLESGSVVCLGDRTIIGVVAETLGRVDAPLYSVAFTNLQEVKDYGIEKGTKIFYVENHATFVFTQPLKLVKGSDASNFFDEEIGDDEMEFSDDETEAEHKRRTKQLKLARKGVIPAATRMTGPESRKPVPGATKNIQYPEKPISYDEEEGDGLYTPLTRPASLLDPAVHLRPMGNSKSFRGQVSRGRGNRGRAERFRRGSTKTGWQDQSADISSSSSYASNQNPKQLEKGGHSSPRTYGPPPYQSSLARPAQYPLASSPHMLSPPGLFPTSRGNDNTQPSLRRQDYAAVAPQYGMPYLPPVNPGESLPPGSFVNPAFFRNQQLFPPQTAHSQPHSQFYQQPGYRRTLQEPQTFTHATTGSQNRESASADGEYDPTRPWID